MKELNTEGAIPAPDPKKANLDGKNIVKSGSESSTKAPKKVKPKKKARKRNWRPLSQLDPVRRQSETQMTEQELAIEALKKKYR
jgi:hypothetical protein